MSKIHVIHENSTWVEPLRSALTALDLPYEEWFMDTARISLDRPAQRRLLQPHDRLLAHPGAPLRPGGHGGSARSPRTAWPAGGQRQPSAAARGEQGGPVREELLTFDVVCRAFGRQPAPSRGAHQYVLHTPGVASSTEWPSGSLK